jgi:hypothetical protein
LACHLDKFMPIRIQLITLMRIRSGPYFSIRCWSRSGSETPTNLWLKFQRVPVGSIGTGTLATCTLIVWQIFHSSHFRK